MNGLDDLKRNPAVIHLYTERVKLKRDGKELLGICPFHLEKTPSFRVYQHDGVFLHKCFGCGAAGNILQFVEKHDRIPFNKAAELVRNFINKDWSSAREKVESIFKPFAEEKKELKTYSASEYEKLETAFANNKAAQTWLLEQRGITLETAQRLRIGYRQDAGKLAGESNSDVADRGWLAFPTFDGSVVTSIKYRSLVRKSFCKQAGMGTFLFNTPTIDFLEPVFLVEGELDALVLEQAGFRAVSLPNAQTQVRPDWKDALLEAECVILAGDSDAAGAEKMQKLWAEMRERTYLLTWPTGIKDANQYFLETCKRDISVFRTKIAELVNEAKSRPMVGVYSLQESMLASSLTSLADHPQRFRFPWNAVDTMANILPGGILALFATNALSHGTNVLTMRKSVV